MRSASEARACQSVGRPGADGQVWVVEPERIRAHTVRGSTSETKPRVLESPKR